MNTYATRPNDVSIAMPGYCSGCRPASKKPKTHTAQSTTIGEKDGPQVSSGAHLRDMSPRAPENNKPRNPRRNRRGGRGRGRGGSANGSGRSKQARAAAGNPDNRSLVSAESAGEVPVCPVCAEVPQDWAVGTCMHAVCGKCSLRMRVLYKREACVLCITLLTEVVVVPAASFRADAPFDDMRKLATTFDKSVGMHFVSPGTRSEFAEVRGWKCSTCSRIETSAAKLKQHVRAEHNALYCSLCFSGHSSFVSELPMFEMSNERSSQKLREHTRHNHPMCKFCHKHFLGDEDLYAHLQSEHESCSVCERAGRIHEYFRDFEQLERHYASDHFVCSDSGCRGVVFSTKLELQGHEVNRHMSNLPRSARRVRVDLADLASRVDPQQELREEQNRQAARRRAFTSSHVVFSGSDMPAHDVNRRGAGPRSSDSGAGSSRGRSQQSHRPTHPVQVAAAPAQISSSRVPPPSRAPSSSQVPPPSRAPPTSRNPTPGQASGRNPRPPDDNSYRALPLPQNQDESNARSTVLVRRMRAALDPAEFEQFRKASGQFRDGNMDASDYYRVIVDSFGVRFANREMLPELIALLPEADKRSALTAAVTGATGGGSAATESSHDFPTLEGTRSTAPNLTPTVRGPYLPIPQASDFPRLNRVNRSTEVAPASTSSSSQAPNFDINRMFGPSPRPQPPAPQPRRAMQSITNPGSLPSLTGAPASPAATLQPSAFPALGVTHPPAATPTSGRRPAHMSAAAVRPPPPQQHPFVQAFPGLRPPPPPPPADPFPALGFRRGVVPPSHRRLDDEPEPVEADVTNRAGAVWGGTAGSSRRRRGPGSREPAPLPGSSNGRSVVIDVVEAAAERRRKIEQSALPKVGGGGFGFAWERKKNLKKKREIKNSFAGSASGSGAPSESNGSAT